MGEGWDSLAPALSALKRARDIAFIGPEPDGSNGALIKSSPTLLLVSHSVGTSAIVRLRQSPNGSGPAPPLLLCVPHDHLEQDDLYELADDFVAVPCSALELDKRMRRLAARRSTPPASVTKIGPISVDLTNYRVSVDGAPVRLAWMEFQLLKFLMQNPGRIFTRQELLDRVWNTQHYGNTRTVDVHIRRLRFKLGPAASEYIRTVTNVGYGLIAP